MDLMEELKPLKLSGKVGFESLPDQMVAKAIQKGFDFNIMCIGETGIGKSSFMESLFHQTMETTECFHDLNSIGINSCSLEVVEKNVRVKLTVVETRGFGDQLNKAQSLSVIPNFIEQQFDNYFNEEMKINRNWSDFHDKRIHVCLYFLAPNCHTMRGLDLATMQLIHDKVNLIPIIAKADTVTKAELQLFKQKINEELETNQIKCYTFPLDDPQVDQINAAMNSLMPFAVVASKEVHRLPDGRQCRGRLYPWGLVRVDDATHCEFVQLREMLLRVNMQALREHTHTHHYGAYRRRRLQRLGFPAAEVDPVLDHNHQVDDQRKEEEGTEERPSEPGAWPDCLLRVFEKARLKQREEHRAREEQIRQLFVTRVREKDEELKEAERKLNLEFEAVKKRNLEERRHLEERKRQFEEEVAAFERSRRQVEQTRSSSASLGPMKKKK